MDGDDALNEREWIAAMILVRNINNNRPMPTKLPAELH
jgi:hypothetical protein